jgi:hypothetical protein
VRRNEMIGSNPTVSAWRWILLALVLVTSHVATAQSGSSISGKPSTEPSELTPVAGLGINVSADGSHHRVLYWRLKMGRCAPAQIPVSGRRRFRGLSQSLSQIPVCRLSH